MLLDFQGVDAQSPRRRRQGSYERCAGGGSARARPLLTPVARSLVMGPPHQRVSVVLLDIRYLRPCISRAMRHERANSA
jgi:hypothetical protein